MCFCTGTGQSSLIRIYKGGFNFTLRTAYSTFTFLTDAGPWCEGCGEADDGRGRHLPSRLPPQEVPLRSHRRRVTGNNTILSIIVAVAFF